MNLIRIGMTPSPDAEALPILQLYGYSSDIFFNISGEFIMAVVLLVFTLLIKAANIFMKMENFRILNSKLRPVWNGFGFCVMPRVAMFIGFQTRNIF